MEDSVVVVTGCKKLREVLGLGFECCRSCHGEWADGYGEAMEIEFVKDGVSYEAYTCCGGAAAFKTSKES